MKGGHVPIHVMRWAAADFVNDPVVKLALARRDYAAIVLYILVLNWSFMEGGDLPADPEALAAIIGMRQADVERGLPVWLRPPVDKPKLFIEETCLFNPRVKREVAEELSFREEQSERGREGNRRRWGRGRDPAAIANESPPRRDRDRRAGSGRDRPPSPSPAPAPITEGRQERARDEAPPTAATPDEARTLALSRLGPNPHVDRVALVAEGNRAIPIISRLADLDPTEVLSKASRWNSRSYVRLDVIPDDRLAHTVEALRTWERRLTGKAEPEMPEPPPRSAPPNARAQERLRGMNAMIRGGLRGEGRDLDAGLEGTARVLPGPGSTGGSVDGEGRRLPPGTGEPDR